MDAKGPLTFWRIRRILDNSRDTAEREQAATILLQLLWYPLPWIRYKAACMLTTRVYLPYGMHPMEFMSFPSVFLRRLRKLQRIRPETPELVREKVREILCEWLNDWSRAYRNPSGRQRAVIDIGADVCEAIGRLGFYEAERALLDLLHLFGRIGGNEVRTALLIALAELPPARLSLLWEGLKAGEGWDREILAATMAYMGNADAVPFLLEALNYQTPEHYSTVLRPLLRALGAIGDTRALPALNAIVRDENHPERATARLAIQRLMKQAEGHEEVSLLRASDLSTLNRDVLLRASDGADDRLRSEELLRPSASETTEQGG
ncbi:MAG TPA: HEAT repeat domain-containing protein [Chthonomonadaceae bacterium]|nr:HEAT repeat domain-containing protein [Chthonomonadaceae bacterium]